jgi:hypothetical protein
MTGWRLGAVAVLALLVAAWACSSEPPPDNSPDPCAVLGTECHYCTDPVAKEACENALATSDDIQCTVALSDSNVAADCVVPDGGGDAEIDGAGGALLACDPTVAQPDAGCSCEEPCATSCPAGGCDITCPAGDAGAVCTPSCDGGRCEIHCLPGATCEASCAGGFCVWDCQAGSTCASSCAGGGCVQQCADDSVCNNTPCPPSPPSPVCNY